MALVSYKGAPQYLFAQVSNANSSVSALNNAATFTGQFEECHHYPCVHISLITDQSGVLYIDFSNDETNVNKTVSYNITAATFTEKLVSVSNRYFRVRFTNNSGANQTYIRLETKLSYKDSIQADDGSGSTHGRILIQGICDNGERHDVSATPEGHLEVDIHGPRNPFGSIHVENQTPIYQSDAVYGLNSGETGQTVVITSGSATVTSANSLFVVSTGTTANSFSELQSRRRLRYRPGQGMISRFTGIFTAGVADSYQLIGPGNSEDGFFFGYKGTSFGIIYRHHGVRETQTLTITTASTTTENITVTLDGVSYSVAVTNSGNIKRTVYEISRGAFGVWGAEPNGATIVFTNISAGDKVGSFSITATTAVGSFAQTKQGVNSTEEFISQSSWNGDTLNGLGHSAVVIDPQKLNVFQVKLQYLGAGAVTFEVEICPDTNNPYWVVVHTFKFPNTLTTSSMGNPAFPFSIIAYSTGSTTNLVTKSASFAGLIEGQKLLQGNRFSYYGQSTAVDAATFRCLFTIRNLRYFGGRANQSVINLLSLSGAMEGNSPATIYILRSAALVGNPSFSQYSSNSCSSVDISATTCTISSNDQIIFSCQVGKNGNFSTDFHDDLNLQPGEQITIAAKSTFGTPSYVSASLNTREDQ